jgi:hypothetical protein
LGCEHAHIEILVSQFFYEEQNQKPTSKKTRTMCHSIHVAVPHRTSVESNERMKNKPRYVVSHVFVTAPWELLDTSWQKSHAQIHFSLSLNRRPLSAYNLFFQDERVKLLESLPQPEPSSKSGKKSHGKIGFAGLARTIANKWKVANASTKAYYEQLAAKEKRQYALDMIKWAQQQEQDNTAPVQSTEHAGTVHSTVSPDSSVASSQSIQEQDSFESSMLMEAPVPSMEALQGNFSCLGEGSFRSNQMMTQSQGYGYHQQASSSLKRGNLKMDVGQRSDFHAATATPSSTSYSTDMLNAFLEQPGMADLVSEMYQLLSQRMGHMTTTNQSQQSSSGFTDIPRRNSMRPRMLQRLSMDLMNTGSFNDPLLGNLEPLDQNYPEGLDEDTANWIGEMFPSY